jgi:hypothetical protein
MGTRRVSRALPPFERKATGLGLSPLPPGVLTLRRRAQLPNIAANRVIFDKTYFFFIEQGKSMEGLGVRRL